MIKTKPFEIFSGTGGVGKTTLAASRAIWLAEQGLSVLLITIDPSKRLKEVLKLKDEDAGHAVTVKDPFDNGSELNLQALLMSPEATLRRIAEQGGESDLSDNRIMKILGRPYGGLNEILSLVELKMNMDQESHDVIVLDTPPGGHFLDFLESAHKIKAFFNQSFVEIFNSLGKGDGKAKKGARFMTKIVSSGVKKLLSYLSKVTGASFVDDFVDAVYAIYQSKDAFLGALELEENLKDSKKSNWFLVTSVEQNKIKEAMELSEGAKGLLDRDSYVVLNKCLRPELEAWEPKEELGKMIKDSIVEREKNHEGLLGQKFEHILRFSEILKTRPIDHVQDLKAQWEDFSSKNDGDSNGKI